MPILLAGGYIQLMQITTKDNIYNRKSISSTFAFSESNINKHQKRPALPISNVEK